MLGYYTARTFPNDDFNKFLKELEELKWKYNIKSDHIPSAADYGLPENYDEIMDKKYKEAGTNAKDPLRNRRIYQHQQFKKELELLLRRNSITTGTDDAITGVNKLIQNYGKVASNLNETAIPKNWWKSYPKHSEILDNIQNAKANKLLEQANEATRWQKAKNFFGKVGKVGGKFLRVLDPFPWMIVPTTMDPNYFDPYGGQQVYKEGGPVKYQEGGGGNKPRIDPEFFRKMFFKRGKISPIEWTHSMQPIPDRTINYSLLKV